MRLISIISAVFLSRILDPSDFGAIALVMVIIGTSNLFSDFGMGKAIIQSRSDTAKLAFHGFIITVLIGFILSVIVYQSSSYLATILGDSELTSLLRFLAPLIFFSNLSKIPEGLLKKELKFGTTSAITIISEIIYLVVALTLANLGFKVWSLAYAFMAKHIICILFYWLLCPGWQWLIPKKWEWKAVNKLTNFGIPFTISGFLSYINRNYPSIFIGNILGTAAVGFYSRAFLFANMPVVSINQVINSVLFSSYSKIQKDKDRLSMAYLKGLSLVSLFTIPMPFGLLILAPDLILKLLGAKWLGMLIPLQILCVMALVRLISQTTSPLFLSIGKPGYNTRIGFVQMIIIILVSVLFIDKGISGFASALVIAYSIGLCYNMYLLNTVFPKIIPKILNILFPSIVSSFFMILGLYIVKKPIYILVGDNNYIISLFLQLTVGVLCYFSIILMLKRSLLAEIWDLSKEIIKVKPKIVVN